VSFGASVTVTKAQSLQANPTHTQPMVTGAAMDPHISSKSHPIPPSGDVKAQVIPDVSYSSSEDEFFDATDDEEEDDSDTEEDMKVILKGSGSSIVSDLDSGMVSEAAVVSDLSEEEKVLLLSSRKKSKEERQHERRQKREQNREKREYEKKRRRERHGKHRRDGLVQEHFIPRRTEKEKKDLMTFEEMRLRLANRDQIREKQEAEERAEEERELEQAARHRREVETKSEAHAGWADTLSQIVAAQERRKQAQREQQTEESSTPNKSKQVPAQEATDSNETDAERKIKTLFLKETSKIVVKSLEEYRAAIKSKEDFKYLAKKLTHMIMAGELKHGKRLEELKFTESVKKKTTNFVRKYMAKHDKEYQRSPPSQQGPK